MSKKTSKKQDESSDQAAANEKQGGRKPTGFNQKPPRPASERRKRPYTGPGSKGTKTRSN